MCIETKHGVANSGWQNPYIFNARYALLVGGGDTDSSKNFDAFWKDTKKMYNNLVNNYNYLDENVYLHFWSHQEGDKDGIHIDGPADWEVSDDYVSTYGLGISQSLVILATKMTKNDFFVLLVTSHGGISKKKGDGGGKVGEGWIQTYNLENDHNYVLYYNRPGLENSLRQSLDGLCYARIILAFSACGSGTAIHGTEEYPEWNLKGDNRVIITDTDKNEEGYTEFRWDESIRDDHGAFLYRGRIDEYFYPDDRDEVHPGFLLNMGSSSSPHTVDYAFDKGYDAATHNAKSISGGDILHTL